METANEPTLPAGSSLHERSLVARHLQRIFQNLESDQLQRATASLRWRQLQPGGVLFHAGEGARAACVLVTGRLQVYGHSGDGQLLPLATIDDPGHLIGEQSLLPGHGFRNATVLALEPTRLAEIPAEQFQELVLSDPQATLRLQATGQRQLRQRLEALGHDLIDRLPQDAQLNSLQFAPGSQVFAAGSIPPSALYVVSGQLELRHPDCATPHTVLGTGTVIHGRELLESLPGRDEGWAGTMLELLPIPLERLQPAGGADQDNQLLTSLNAIHTLPGLGTAYRYLSQENGRPCVITDYEQPDGRRLRVLLHPSNGMFEATRRIEPGLRLDDHSSPDGRQHLLVASDDLRLIGLRAALASAHLDELMAALLRDAPLDPLQLAAFRSSGRLLVEEAEERVADQAGLVCACTGTTATRLRQFAEGCHSVAELQRRCGVGTICGGCRSRLPIFVGAPRDDLLCRLWRRPLAEGAVEIVLESLEEQPLPAMRGGEHIKVEALIDGRWIGRTYTLIDAAPDRYVIGVRQEPGGLFSNWLATAAVGELLRVSEPTGELVPDPTDPRPLLYLVAGIGVTPAMAGLRHLAGSRRLVVGYTYRGKATAAYLGELRQAAAEARISLLEHDSSAAGRRSPGAWVEQLDTHTSSPFSKVAVEVVVCGPASFNSELQQDLAGLCPAWELRLESFAEATRQDGDHQALPGEWRLPAAELERRRQEQERRLGPAPLPMPVGRSDPQAEAREFLVAFQREEQPNLDLNARLAVVQEELVHRGQWAMERDELDFGARLAWRQSERCVGRLYWQGLQLLDRRDLQGADAMAEALFDHLRYAENGGDLRPAISVFDPGEPGRPGPRLWNPQLLRYAGHRFASGRQLGDPSQNELTRRIRALGWTPSGGDFELLPLVIEIAGEGPRLFPLPDDCRRQVTIRHPEHPWLENLGLRWPAVPAVSDMALDVGGNLFRMAPFNGWYLDTEIASRNFTDVNRYNLLPRLAEGLGLDIRDDRNLWRDKAQLMLNEAVLDSFDRAGVKIADHHGVGHEFLEFCRAEQAIGREPQAEWSWVVPPMSSSLSVLYQEPFDNAALKPAYVTQPAIWAHHAQAGAGPGQGAAPRGGCPFS